MNHDLCISDELSECADRKPSLRSETFNEHWNRTIAYSEAACQPIGNIYGKIFQNTYLQNACNG